MTKSVPKKRTSGKKKPLGPESMALVPIVPPSTRKRPWSSIVTPQSPAASNRSKPATPESQEQREAFDRYLSMGDARTMEKIAIEIGRNTQTVRKWGREYNWVRRVIAHEALHADNLLIEPHSIQQEKRKFGLQMIDKILRSTVTLSEDGTIATCSVEAKSPSDIRTLLTLRDELLNPEKGSKTTFGKGSQINAENAVFIIKK
jgi:hypothetical protein